jgi:non-specific serine/threonine protein kinase/serine/threonine-protein kinase
MIGSTDAGGSGLSNDERRDENDLSGSETREVPPVSSAIPKKIGQYRVRRAIASGGMGTIYEAVQEQPRRTVAIKVMKQGVTSRSALRRFEYESQLLARLSHPAIAQVYDAGTHDDGAESVPFFAMEYIPNAKSITDYAKDRKLGTREKLELFVQICDAVHHGHQKGIIHRDLKPGNILVDSHGRPKIIDFGVARATDSDMAMATLQTDVGQFIGTLQYMSPEQCEADPHDIDTRSDVYALGLVLYDLLCGRLPYDVTGVPLTEAARLIRERGPNPPSASVPNLRGDVETIVMKAIEKDRDRRYQSTHGLAQDIRRYLAGEAIAARPPSLAYQLRVFARRNKTLLGATAAVLVVLVAGVIVSTSLYMQARADRARAERQREAALAAVSYLGDVVDSADPANVGLEVKIADLLDRYGENIDEAFPDQPEIEATVRTAISGAYAKLDRYEKRGTAIGYQQSALRHIEAALELRRSLFGDEHPATLETMVSLADLLWNYGDSERARKLTDTVLEVRRRTLGEEHPDTLSAIADTVYGLLDLDRLEEAERLASGVLEARRRVLGDEAPATLSSMVLLGELRHDQERHAEAEALFQEATEGRRKLYGDGHWRTEEALSGLANTFIAQNRTVEAAALFGNPMLPQDLGIEKWYQNEIDLHDGQPTVVAMWEAWCPYSYREIPKLEDTYAEYKERGLRIVGVTQVTRSATDEKVLEFLEQKGLSFPMAKHDGTIKAVLNPRGGVPSAAVVLDDRVLWRGHPANMSEAMLDAVLGAANGPG